MDEDLLTAIRANLFAGSHGAIPDWQTFPWHKDGYGTLQPHSSQALAIDVLGALQTHPSRDHLIPALLKVAFPYAAWRSTSWNIRLEVKVEELGEPTPTQLDALIEGDAELIAVESKFCEQAAGACGQPDPLQKGPNKGLIQCNGNYEMQRNPVNAKTARCALTAKGIRYWTYIPELFDIGADIDQRPCFFRGDRYQLMRNVVAAHALARAAGKTAGTLLLFVDGPGFPMSRHVREPGSAWNGLLEKLRPEQRPRVSALSYQAVIGAFLEAAPEDRTVCDLSRWFRERKLPAGVRACEGVRP